MSENGMKEEKKSRECIVVHVLAVRRGGQPPKAT